MQVLYGVERQSLLYLYWNTKLPSTFSHAQYNCVYFKINFNKYCIIFFPNTVLYFNVIFIFTEATQSMSATKGLTFHPILPKPSRDSSSSGEQESPGGGAAMALVTVKTELQSDDEGDEDVGAGEEADEGPLNLASTTSSL